MFSYGAGRSAKGLLARITYRSRAPSKKTQNLPFPLLAIYERTTSVHGASERSSDRAKDYFSTQPSPGLGRGGRFSLLERSASPPAAEIYPPFHYGPHSPCDALRTFPLSPSPAACRSLGGRWIWRFYAPNSGRQAGRQAGWMVQCDSSVAHWPNLQSDPVHSCTHCAFCPCASCWAVQKTTHSQCGDDDDDDGGFR